MLLMPFSASTFCFISSTCAKIFPFEDFFHLGNKTKLLGARSGEYVGGWGMGIMPLFGQKLVNTQQGVGRLAGKLPIMKWAKALKES